MTPTPPGPVEPSLNARVWQVLVEECGARPDLFDEFDYHWPQCGEFRFQGSLAFGGKIYSDGRGASHVSMYSEDRTPERIEAARRANERLAELAAVPGTGEQP